MIRSKVSPPYVIGIVLCVCVSLLYFSRSSVSLRDIFNPAVPFDELKAMLDFVPAKNQFSCEDLFVGTPAQRYNMTPTYHSLRNEYMGKTGSSGKFPEEEYRALHYIAGRRFVRNVCETGFNAGGSSFNHLTASETSAVHSFELGGNLYRAHVAKWLSEKFGDRFSIHLGDSTVSVPEFAKQNPGFRCDFMYVDGGHVYPVARADMINFSNMANLKNNFIAFDDYPPGWGDFGKAWEESLKDGTVREIFRCAYKNFGGPRGFVVGVVVRHPDGSP